MGTQKYNLCWNEFERSASHTFRSLLTDTEFTDVTIASHSGEGIKAHKVVLSNCSPVFHQLLLKHPASHPTIYLRGVRHTELKAVIEFVYLGQTEIDEHDLQRFVSVAKDLEIKGLSEDLPSKSQRQNAVTFQEAEKKESQEIDHDVYPDIRVGKNSDNGAEESSSQISDIFTEFSAGVAMNSESSNNSLVTFNDERGMLVSVVGDPNQNHNQNHGESLGRSNLMMNPFASSGVISSLFGEKEKFACDQCDFIAKNRTYLKCHVESKHEGKKYGCDKCHRSYNFPGDLRRHQKSVHDGIRYSCHLCEFEATQPQTLKKHLVKAHSDSVMI